MTYGLHITTAATEEPITLPEAKTHCGIGLSIKAHDAVIATSIRAARAHVEAVTNRAIITQTRELLLNHFPSGSLPIFVPFTPLQSVTSIYYIDTDGNSTEWASLNYRVSTSREPGEIHRAWNSNWPTVRHVVDAIIVTYVAGYGTQTAVPPNMRAAMLLLIDHWFRHRSEVEAGSMQKIPMAASDLLEGLSVGDEFVSYGEP